VDFPVVSGKLDVALGFSPVVSGKLDVALGLRMNQYKLFVHLSLP